MTTQFNRLLALLTAATLGGCVVGPEYHRVTPEQAAPEHFPAVAPHNAAAHALERDAWWYGFHDPAMNVLVQAALRHGPDMQAAEANIRQARAGMAQIGAANLPQLNGEMRAGRDQFSKEGENFANIPLPNPQTGFNDYRGGLDASWEIDLFGHTARSLESAAAKLGGTQAQQEDIALRVAAETARGVLDYRFLQLRIANAHATLHDNQALLHLVQLQYDAGLASALEIKQAAIAVRNAEAVLPLLDTSAQSTVLALIPLTGMTREALDAQLGTPAGEPGLPEAASFAVSSLVLEHRPDLRIAERQLAAASADVGVAMADRYPRFTLVGDAGWESIHPGQFSQNASRYWNVGPQISVPVLNGNRIEAGIKGSEAARDAAVSNYRKAVLVALADAESSMLRCQGDHERLGRLDKAVALQEEEIALISRRIEVGEAPQSDMLNAKIQLRQLTEQQLATRQALADDIVLLYKSLGGRTGE